MRAEFEECYQMRTNHGEEGLGRGMESLYAVEGAAAAAACSTEVKGGWPGHSFVLACPSATVPHIPVYEAIRFGVALFARLSSQPEAILCSDRGLAYSCLPRMDSTQEKAASPALLARLLSRKPRHDFA